VADYARREHDVKLQAAANNIRLDAATAEVLRGFEAAGVESRLLKGPALAVWYAGDETRAYLDCDLWVCPAHANVAADVLPALGFRAYLDEGGLPDWFQEHASTWSRDSDGVLVDLHTTLQGLGVDAKTAWDILSPSVDTVLVSGYPARTLSLAARALYITLHAAHHGSGWGKALRHLERALSSTDEPLWRSAYDLAQQLDAVDAFATGMRLVPDGAVMAKKLGLPATQSVRVALQATTPPPIALGFDELARAEGFSRRVAIVVRKIAPPPGFVRHWWPPAARSKRLLVVGYMYRPVWLVRYAPRGYRAWRKARRGVRGGR
jgi:Uncharacterised nucleotidyltransferase